MAHLQNFTAHRLGNTALNTRIRILHRDNIGTYAVKKYTTAVLSTNPRIILCTAMTKSSTLHDVHCTTGETVFTQNEKKIINTHPVCNNNIC